MKVIEQIKKRESTYTYLSPKPFKPQIQLLDFFPSPGELKNLIEIQDKRFLMFDILTFDTLEIICAVKFGWNLFVDAKYALFEYVVGDTVGKGL